MGGRYTVAVMTVCVVVIAGVMSGQKRVVSACAVMEVTPWCAKWRTVRT